MVGLCTFCDESLDDSLEHIILSAIGGRKRSRSVVCSTHNNAFGSSIDKVLTEQLATFSNLFAIRTGRNQEAATLRGLATTDGTRIDLEPGGRFVTRSSISDTEVRPGEREIQVRASSLEEGRALMATYLLKYNKGLDELQKATVQESITSSSPVPFTNHVGGEDACRAIAKMALLLLAADLGTDVVRGPDTMPIRSFITSGGEAADHVRVDFATMFELPASIAALPAHAHRLAAFASAATGVALGIVELFGGLRFSVLLSENWAGPSVALFYGVDPVTGIQAEERVSTPPPLTAAEFRTLTYTDVDVERRMKRLFQMIEARRLDVNVNRITREVWSELVPPKLAGTPMTPELAERIANEVASRFMAAHFGRPYARTLEPAEALGGSPPADAPRKRKRRRKQ